MTASQQLRQSGDESSADCIRQIIEVNNALDGVATVRIEITGLRAHRAVELVRLLTPHCRAVAEEHVRNTEFAVVRQSGDPVRYILAEPEGLELVEWSYKISNAVQLRRSDLFFCNARAPWRSTLKASETWNPYRVRLRCKTFIQEIVLPQEVQVAFKRAHGSEGHNSQQRAIARAGELMRDTAGNRATMTVHDPDPDACYGIVYEPLGPNGNYAEAADVAADIVHACLTERASKGCVSELLADRVHRHLSKTIVSNPNLLDGISWTVLLWSRRHRRLVPVFCRGPIETWSARFAYGNGIAGHSFRFALPAGFVTDHESTPSLIHQKGEDVEGVQLTDYGWVVALPLERKNEDEHPAGVLTLSGLKQSDALVELAKLLTNPNNSDPGELLANALHNANCSFWSALVEVQERGRLNLQRHAAYLADALVSYRTSPAELRGRPSGAAPSSPAPVPFGDFEVEFGLPWFKAKAKGRMGLALTCLAIIATAIYLYIAKPDWFRQVVQDQKALQPVQASP